MALSISAVTAPSFRSVRDDRFKKLIDAVDQGFCVIKMVFDETGKPVDYIFLETNAAFESQTGLVDALGKSMRELEANHEEHWFEIYGRIAKSGIAERFEAPAEALGHEYEVYAFPFDEPGLMHVGILFGDISERKRAERMQQVLVAELNHRVKNTLAVVHSIVRQSLQGVDEASQVALLGRLEALGRAQDALAEGQWHKIRLCDLVRNTLEPYGEVGAGRTIELAGPPLMINAKAAQSFTLAFHELATNAAKYGALSVESGTVRVGWELLDEDERRFRLTWAEDGGPEIAAPPTRTGFGTRLIEHALAFEIGGEVGLSYERSGLRVTVEAPAENLVV